jgi:hypothetical protein
LVVLPARSKLRRVAPVARLSSVTGTLSVAKNASIASITFVRRMVASGSGLVEFEGDLNFATQTEFVHAITGGTGAYRDASGEFHFDEQQGVIEITPCRRPCGSLAVRPLVGWLCRAWRRSWARSWPPRAGGRVGLALGDGERSAEAEQRDPRSGGGADARIGPVEPAAAGDLDDAHGRAGDGGPGRRGSDPGERQRERADCRDGLVHPISWLSRRRALATVVEDRGRWSVLG